MKGHEIKYVLAPCRVGPVRHHLQGHCREDGAYPKNQVISLYFDTLDLRFAAAKVNSDYLKTKVRLRWYENLDGGSPSSVFLEVKHRFGTRRSKDRRPVDLQGTDLAARPFHHPALAQMPQWLASLGYRPPGLLRPLLVVRYQRHRFVSPNGTDRVAIDENISLEATDSFRLPPRIAKVANAVLEFKGPTGGLPKSLRSLYRLGLRRDSFSKYGACFDLASGA